MGVRVGDRLGLLLSDVGLSASSKPLCQAADLEQNCSQIDCTHAPLSSRAVDKETIMLRKSCLRHACPKPRPLLSPKYHDDPW
jgi:hypothetical protein